MAALPTSVTGWPGAGSFEPGGLPGPGLPGFGAAVRTGSCAVDGPESPPGPARGSGGPGQGRALPGQGAGLQPGPRGEPEAGRSRRGSARSTGRRRAGSRSFGLVQPRTCFRKPERMFDIKPAQETPASSGSPHRDPRPGRRVHSQTGLGARSCGRCSTVSLTRGALDDRQFPPGGPAQAPRGPSA